MLQEIDYDQITNRRSHPPFYFPSTTITVTTITTTSIFVPKEQKRKKTPFAMHDDMLTQTLLLIQEAR